MASAVLDRRGAVVARGVLVTVHDLYGGSLPLRPLEWYMRYGRGMDVESFWYRPRLQVRPQSLWTVVNARLVQFQQRNALHLGVMWRAEPGDVGEAYVKPALASWQLETRRQTHGCAAL